MSLLESQYFAPAPRREFSSQELGITNAPIEAGVSTITSNTIDVQGFKQIVLVMIISQNMDQLICTVHNEDDAPWETISGGAGVDLLQITLLNNTRVTGLVPHVFTFGTAANISADPDGDQDAGVIYKNINFAFSESAPGVGSSTNMTAKLFLIG